MPWERTQSNADSPDTDARIDTKPPAADRSNESVNTLPAALVSNTTDHGQFRFFVVDPDARGDALDEFVAGVTTVAQSQCERATDYTDIETLVCRLPIDHLTFAAHDASAPYAGPYPMAIHVRAGLLTEINGWDETALHDHLRAHPSLRQNLGFETLPNQSTFWRAWNERFSADLCDGVRECADTIVKAARACDVSLPDRSAPHEPDEPEADDLPKHLSFARWPRLLSE